MREFPGSLYLQSILLSLTLTVVAPIKAHGSSGQEVFRNDYAVLSEEYINDRLNLYTWVDFEDLPTIANIINENNQITRFPLLEGVNIQQFAFLKGKSGVFSFHNLYAFRGGKRESYGNHLIRYTLKKNSRILYAKSLSDTFVAAFGVVGQHEFDASPYDAIYIQKPLNEWIILKPEALESFTASPEEMNTEIEQGLRDLSNPHFRLKLEDTHNDISNAKMRDIAKNLLKGVLSRQEFKIPNKFKISYNQQVRSLSKRLSYEEYLALIMETIRKIPELKFTSSATPQYLSKNLTIGVLYWVHHNLLKYPLQTVRTMPVPEAKNLINAYDNEPLLTEREEGSLLLHGVRLSTKRIESSVALKKLYSGGEVEFFGRMVNSLEQMIQIITDLERFKETAILSAFATGQLEYVLLDFENNKLYEQTDGLVDDALKKLFRVCNNDPQVYIKVLKKYGLYNLGAHSDCASYLLNPS